MLDTYFPVLLVCKSFAGFVTTLHDGCEVVVQIVKLVNKAVVTS